MLKKYGRYIFITIVCVKGLAIFFVYNYFNNQFFLTQFANQTFSLVTKTKGRFWTSLNDFDVFKRIGEWRNQKQNLKIQVRIRTPDLDQGRSVIRQANLGELKTTPPSQRKGLQTTNARRWFRRFRDGVKRLYAIVKTAYRAVDFSTKRLSCKSGFV